MITISINGNSVRVTRFLPVVAGTVGMPVFFEFDESWQGLSKTAVFRVGSTVMDQVNIGSVATVPWELLQKPGCRLFVGVCGTDGTKSLPTLWADLGEIQSGADPSGEESIQPSLPVWQQLSNQVDQLFARCAGSGIQPVYLFADLSSAIAAVNADDFSGEIPEKGNVAVTRYAPGAYRVDLLNDLEEYEPVTVTADIALYLNGKTLRIYVNGTAMTFASESNCTIDGSISGSAVKLVTVGENAGKTHRFLFRAGGQSLRIHKGVYEVNDSIQNSNVVAAVSVLSGSFWAEECSFYASSVSGSIRTVQGGGQANVELVDCDIKAIEPPETTLTTVIAVYSTKKLKMDRCSATTVAKQAGCGVYILGADAELTQCKVIVDSIINTQVNAGTGVDISGAVSGNDGTELTTTVSLRDCYVFAGHTGIHQTYSSNVYVRGGTYIGYSHGGLYATHNVGYDSCWTDAVLSCSDIPDGLTYFDKTQIADDNFFSCCYVGCGEKIGQSVYFDGCVFRSPDAIDEAMVLRAASTGETNTTVNLSNCMIDIDNATPIRIETGGSAVNVGINTVDKNGKPVTQANVKSTELHNTNSDPNNLHITGKLYRRLSAQEVCTGKDLKTFWDYIAGKIQ